MKRYICLIMVLCMLSVCFVSCGDNSSSKAKNIEMSELSGTWEVTEKLEDVASVKAKFRKSEDPEISGAAVSAEPSVKTETGFYDEEIALMDFDSIRAIKTLTFTASDDKRGTYEYKYDKEATQVYTKKFAEDFISACYDNLASLEKCYGAENVSAIKSFEDFKAYYCEMLGCTGYEELIEKISDFVFNSEIYTTYADKGEFEIEGSMLLMTSQPEEMYAQLGETAKQEEEKQTQVGAVIENGNLTLTYKVGNETYIKR